MNLDPVLLSFALSILSADSGKSTIEMWLCFVAGPLEDFCRFVGSIVEQIDFKDVVVAEVVKDLNVV